MTNIDKSVSLHTEILGTAIIITESWILVKELNEELKPETKAKIFGGEKYQLISNKSGGQ